MTSRSSYRLTSVAALLAAGLVAVLVAGLFGIGAWWSSPDVVELLAEASAARKRGEHARALELYDRVTELGSPTQSADGHAWAALLLLQRMNQLDRSESRYRRALAIDPDHVEANRGLAMLLSVSGRRWESVPFIRRVLQSGQAEPSDGSEVNLLRLMDVGGGLRLDTAVLTAALLRNSDDPVALLGLAVADLKSGRSGRAIERARRALELRSDLLAARSVIGRGLLSSDRIAELIEWHDRLPESAEGDPRVWVVRGEFHDRAGQGRAAARCYWEALKRHPDHRKANYRLGELLRELGREADAERFVQRLADLQALREIDDLMIAGGGVGSLELVRRKVERLERMGRVWEAWGWARLAEGRDAETGWVAETVVRTSEQLTSEPSPRLTRDSSNPALALDLSEWSRPEWLVESIAADSKSGAGAGVIASFRDDAAESGLVFGYINGRDASGSSKRMSEFTGGGVAVLDYDGDGWPDVYLAQGGGWPVDRGDSGAGDRLFRNRGDGRFEDVTGLAGLMETGFGQGVAAGDIDGDGWPDLHIANIGGNRLYLNNGDGTFRDATDASGLPGDGDTSWSTSCSIADINGDGHADIYVVNYLSGSDLFTRVCRGEGGVLRMCQPFQFAPASDRLYLGRGDGTFRDASREAGVDAEGGKGLGVVVSDLDGDGRLELFVANDTRANFLFRIRGDGDGRWRLHETGLVAGVGLSGEGRAEGSMGVAVGDTDGDGRPELFVTNFLDETNTLYSGIGPGLGSDRFSDRTRRAGLASSSLSTLGFGTQFLDADLDGDIDLLVANGHVDDYSDLGRPHTMATQYYRNRGDGRFDLITDKAQGVHFKKRLLGRGLAVLDWNRDLRPDAIITSLDVPTVLLTNTTSESGAGLVLKLIATAGHRDAIGTRVRVEFGKRAAFYELTSGDGYLASNQRRLLIGVGGLEGTVRVEVSWPGRSRQVFEALGVNREWVLVEGRERAFEWTGSD